MPTALPSPLVRRGRRCYDAPMKMLVSIILIPVAAYLLLALAMFIFQRSLLYFPVPFPAGVERQEVVVENGDIRLHGWLINPGRARALIYFGGNAEAVHWNITDFEILFRDYSVYLLHYRGYGRSEGKPGEAALLSDALAIYDQLSKQYQYVSAMGRSLGSGIAVYLAAQRQVDRLVLVTPYDSIAEVAQHHYPFLPARWVVRDRFESFRHAPKITVPVLLISAEKDEVVPVKSALKLLEHLDAAPVTYRMIEGARHNDITDFDEYRRLLTGFALEGIAEQAR